jgi:hypothetical protein
MFRDLHDLLETEITVLTARYPTAKEQPCRHELWFGCLDFPYSCTRERGHDGLHVAHDILNGSAIFLWDNEHEGLSPRAS